MESLTTLILIAAVVIFSPMIYRKLAGDTSSLFRKIFSLITTVIIAGAFSFIFHAIQNKSFIDGVKRGYEKSQYYKIINDPSRREFGCLTKDKYNTVINIAAKQKDHSIKDHMRKELQSGNCIIFERSETVKLIETMFFEGLVLLERSTDKKQYWAGIDSLNKK